MSVRRLPQLLPQHVANLAWAYGRLTHAHGGLMDALVRTALSYGDQLTMQHLTNIVCAAGLFGWRYDGLVRLAEERVAACLGEEYDTAPPATGGGPGEYDARKRQRRGRAGGQRQWSLTPQQACNLVWGLALVGACSAGLWGRLLRAVGAAVEAQGGIEELPAEALTQVYQVGVRMQLGVQAV